LYKVLIVDDEEWIRAGVKKMIHWEEMDLEFAGEASNGQAAYELIEKNHPDIVLTDIRMPVADGLELIEKSSKLKRNAVFILLSGYADFSYAKRAIQLNICEYLLKPIDEKELTDVLQKAIAQVESKKMNHELLKEKKEEQIAIMLARQQNDRIDFPFKEKYLQIVIVKLDDRNQFIDQTEKYFSGHSALIIKNRHSEDEVIIIYGFDALYEIQQHMKKTKEMLQYYFHKEKYGVAVFSNVQEIKHIFKEFKSMEEYMKCIRFITSGRIVDIAELESRGSTFILSNDARKQLYSYFENAQLEELNAWNDSFIGGLKGQHINPKSIMDSAVNLIMTVDYLLKLYGTSLQDVLDTGLSIRKIVEQVRTMEQLEECIKLTLLGAFEYFLQIKHYGIRNKIREIRKFIKANYQETITLNGVAEKYFINMSYLSRMFKEETGTNFNDYLNKVRLNKSQELLSNSNLRVTQIAEMVGYENVNYFMRKFKEYYSCTPSEYRNRRGK